MAGNEDSGITGNRITHHGDPIRKIHFVAPKNRAARARSPRAPFQQPIPRSSFSASIPIVPEPCLHLPAANPPLSDENSADRPARSLADFCSPAVADFRDDANFILAAAPPANFHIQFRSGNVHELANTVLPPSCDDVILGRILLQHQPLHFHIIARVSPVPLGIEISKKEAILQTELDARKPTGNLARDKSLSAKRGFMVEQDPVASVKPVSFAVVDGDPKRVELGNSIGTARIKRSRLGLRDFLHFAVEFGC